ncbi:MAG: EamA family transporter [Caldimicrobium sp.]|nr:EamA family transporter [Caldimicrobium sp.]MCX7613277.1 EamA family transporter [Caldimicrobium sp.]MDW8182404.1 EamA family transporter [Caldimicrobium sp.]
MDHKTLLIWIATVVFWGISPLIEKLGLKNVDPLIGLFVRTLAALIGISLVIFLTGEAEKIRYLTLRDLFYLSLSGITAGFLGMFFYFSLLKTHQASQIVPLTASYPLVASLLAILILREDITLYKILGTILIVFGIYFLFRSE